MCSALLLRIETISRRLSMANVHFIHLSIHTVYNTSENDYCVKYYMPLLPDCFLQQALINSLTIKTILLRAIMQSYRYG